MDNKKRGNLTSVGKRQNLDKKQQSTRHHDRTSKQSKKQSSKQNRSSGKDHSKNKQRPISSTKNKNKQKNNSESNGSMLNVLKKKPASALAKKKIEQLKPPEILIKVLYKNKRIAIPISNIDDKGLNQSIMPHIVRFQKEILNNIDFNPNQIINWKIVGRGDPIKDYYFQTNRPISVFKNQLLQIQPIWRQNIKNIQNKQIQLSDFQIIKCIGTGGFSRVLLARYKMTGVFYALKCMQKQGLFQKGKQCVVSNQRNILIGLRSPHIVNLQFAFETKHFVVLALQYCPGGELFYYLRKARRMSQEQARYCFVQILLGIQYLHSQKIIYRDIKPQNIMIDANGNLKIADFGLSKQGLRPNQLATTYCGSPQYMAPQMLAKCGHSYALDYYCLGALLYELVTGNPPFYSRDVDKIYYAIQNQDIQFPQNIELSNQIKMLLEGLLMKDPKKRLGSLGGVREILGHPWVRKLKPADILNKTVETPIKIDLLTFNVNEQQIEEGNTIFMDKIQDEDMQFDSQFQQFYFNRYEQNNILDQALPSIKSDSTKQNKSLKIPQSTAIRLTNQHKKGNVEKHNQCINYELFKSGQIDKKLGNYQEKYKEQKKKLKKQKSSKNINLVQRAKNKKRQDKSIAQTVNKEKSLRKNSPIFMIGLSSLSRAKSSAALLDVFDKKKHK